MIFSFGSIKSINNYFDVFIDVIAIDKLDNSRAKDLLMKLKRSTSGFARAWIIAILSVAIGFLTFSYVTASGQG
ncbi:MAG: hypothetical protein QNK78_04165 [Crocinitomicaceae bacterium]|nr:hypothetical protein [Crocinitomicaceae bacterium]MDC0099958.1 hypothetical protein [Crocinitomicaceae bacterium]